MRRMWEDRCAPSDGVVTAHGLKLTQLMNITAFGERRVLWRLSSLMRFSLLNKRLKEGSSSGSICPGQQLDLLNYPQC